MSVTLITGPAEEPLTVAEVKQQLQLDTSDFDSYLSSLITSVRLWAEKTTNRALVTQTWEYKRDNFVRDGDYGSILLPKPPLIAVNSITYIDTAGDTQTFSSAKYTVDTSGFLGRVYPIYGEVWPSTQNIANAVTINFDAGYGAQAAQQEDIKQAMKVVIADLFRNRESYSLGRSVANLPFNHEDLLSHYKVACFG